MESVEYEYRGNMEYIPSLDRTTQFTHDGRVNRNTSTEYLNKYADITRTTQFKNENDKSTFSLKYGLVDGDPSTTAAALKIANDNKYDEARYSGIATRVVPLVDSASMIHNTLLKPDPIIVSSKPKNNINRIRANNRILPDILTIKPISFGTIRNNPNVVNGKFRENSTVNSKTMIHGDSNSKTFGKISNKGGKASNTVSIDQAQSYHSPLPSSTTPDRIISTKRAIPFGLVQNPKQTAFSKVHREDYHNIQKHTDLGLAFTKDSTDYTTIPRS